MISCVHVIVDSLVDSVQCRNGLNSGKPWQSVFLFSVNADVMLMSQCSVAFHVNHMPNPKACQK